MMHRPLNTISHSILLNRPKNVEICKCANVKMNTTQNVTFTFAHFHILYSSHSSHFLSYV